MPGLTFERALGQLLGWIGEPVRVLVRPNGPGAVQVAGMKGTLRRGQTVKPEFQSVLGSARAEDTMFMFVSPHVDHGDEYSYFVIPKDRFRTAFTSMTEHGEMLTMILESATVSVVLIDS